jgi:hypothetical protein
MTITVVDIGTGNSVSGATTSVTVPTGGVPSGSFICIGVNEDSTTASGSVADSKSANSFLKKVSAANNNNNTYGWAAVYIAWNSNPLVAGDTIIYTKGSSGRGTAVSAFYATGIKTSSDPTNLISGPVSATNNVSVTGTPAKGDLVVGFCAVDPRGTGDVVTTTPSTLIPPFTGVIVAGGYCGLSGGHLISDGSSITYNTVNSNTNRHQIAWLLSFRPQVGAFGFNHPFPA